MTRQISKIHSTNQLNFFLVDVVIYFWNKLPYQIKNKNSIKEFKIKLDFRNNKKEFKRTFWGIIKCIKKKNDLYTDIVLILQMLGAKILFFFKDMRR